MSNKDICIICGSSEDYICSDHFTMITESFGGGYTIAVLGGAPRSAVYTEPNTRPAILSVDSIQHLAETLNEWHNEGDDITIYKVMILIDDISYSSISDEDWDWIDYTIKQLPVCILVTRECEESVIKSFNKWNPKEDPISLMLFQDWNAFFELCRDWGNNEVLPMKVLGVTSE